jgi:pimeloyl-ACP methyl ester carboxylesterase
VIALARSLERPPLVLGMSMGGRVALEAVLTAPEAFRGVILVAPFMPWRRWRWPLSAARRIDPAWGDRLPLERIWPVLKRMAEYVDGLPAYEHDWVNRAAVRVVYYGSCPATRAAFLSASRELALDPAFGPDGLWTRLADLVGPATFLWGGRDRLIPSDHLEKVAAVLPDADQLEVACAAHFVSGPHYRCMRRATVLAVQRTREVAAGASSGLRIQVPCFAAAQEREPSAAGRDPTSAAAGAAGGNR